MIENACDNIQEQIVEYITGELTSEKSAALQAHISECKVCKKYLESFQADDELLMNFATRVQLVISKIETNVIQAIQTRELTKPINVLFKWESIMKNRIMKIAAAAIIIIGVFFGIYHFGSSIDGATIAWADVLRSVEKISTFSYLTKSTTSKGDKISTAETKWYFSSEYGIKYEKQMNGKVCELGYVVPNKNDVLKIYPPKKQYLRIKNVTEVNNFKINDPRILLKELLSEKYKELKGIKVKGIEVESPKFLKDSFTDSLVRFWIYTITGLPDHIEIDGHVSGAHIKVVVDDFVWDEPLEKNIFEPLIPENYIDISENVK